VLQPRLANAPKPGRTLRLLTTILLPGGEAGSAARSAGGGSRPGA
jgi:hypothetical protein